MAIKAAGKLSNQNPTGSRFNVLGNLVDIDKELTTEDQGDLNYHTKEGPGIWIQMWKLK